jgi:hypothetical protein
MYLQARTIPAWLPQIADGGGKQIDDETGEIDAKSRCKKSAEGGI